MRAKVDDLLREREALRQAAASPISSGRAAAPFVDAKKS
jgi:hypothetical protein